MDLTTFSNQELHDLQQQLTKETHWRLSQQQPERDPFGGRTVHYWTQQIADSELSWLRQEFRSGAEIEASVLLHVAARHCELTEEDKTEEPHGKNHDGSQRIEVRWQRLFKEALRKGQERPGFPLRKVQGKKATYKLR